MDYFSLPIPGNPDVIKAINEVNKKEGAKIAWIPTCYDQFPCDQPELPCAQCARLKYKKE